MEYRHTVVQYLKDWKTVRYVGTYLLLEYYYLFIIMFSPILFTLLCLVSVSCLSLITFSRKENKISADLHGLR